MTAKKQYIIENILKNHKTDFSKDEYIRKIERKTVKNPVIFVGTGTCGLGAGAGKTTIAVKEYIKKNKINAEIIETGCIGLCSSEPILDVQLPEFNRVSFEKATADKVKQILDSVFIDKSPDIQSVLCQFESSDNKKWNNIPPINELPFFKPQQRIVLKNCGIINPTSIDEYITTGGYTGYLEMIRTKKNDEVCQIVEQSGLRGRGGGGFLTGKKWKFALRTPAKQKYLICNADEGDPGAFMDRAVIEGDCRICNRSNKIVCIY